MDKYIVIVGVDQEATVLRNKDLQVIRFSSYESASERANRNGTPAVVAKIQPGLTVGGVPLED